MSAEDDEVRQEFGRVVNMPPAELEGWLDSEDSQRVGQKDGGGESVGHRSGRRIVEIRRKKVEELSDDDYDHMRKVVGYVHRHLRQGGPEKDVEHSNWRYSRVNWGHDPTR